jgi:hypothetical protein
MIFINGIEEWICATNKYNAFLYLSDLYDEETINTVLEDYGYEKNLENLSGNEFLEFINEFVNEETDLDKSFIIDDEVSTFREIIKNEVSITPCYICHEVYDNKDYI